MSNDLTTPPGGGPVVPGASYDRALAMAEQALGRFDVRLLDRETFMVACRVTERPSADAAKGLLARLPTPAACAAFVADVGQALAQKPNRKGYRALIGLLVDCYPSARPPNLDVYTSTLLHDLCDLGFAPYEVAAGCRAIRRDRTRRYLPSVGELIGACEAAREELQAIHRLALRHADMVDRVHRIAAGQLTEAAR